MLGFLFSPFGRVSRRAMWLKYFFPFVGLNIVASIVDAVIMGSGGGLPVLSLILTAFYLWPSIAVPVKRLHDLGLSGWWLLGFVAIGMVGVALSFGAIVGVSAGAPPQEAMAGAGLGIGVILVGGLVQFVMFYILPGKEGENGFGPDPRDPNAKSAAGRSSSRGDSGEAAWAASALAALETAKASSRTAQAGPAPRRAVASAEPWRPGQAKPAFGRRGA